ncbi:MAG: class I SAM-dependent methyltransferase [Pseudomonadota bacterium]
MERSLLKSTPILDQIAAESARAGLVPHAVTPLQAAFLAMLIRMCGAKRVLEIGCLGGYSAVAMAAALPADGYVLTTEIDTRTAHIAQSNIDASGFGPQIELRIGPALAVLDEQIAQNACFDFVFIDADKVNHKTYLERALALSDTGTVIVADNIVRGGAVLEASSQENSVRGIREMLAFAETLDTVEMTALQTVGEKGYDGMALFRVLR